MKSWIFNASPLILLGKIQRLELVGLLCPQFRIPQAVLTEIGKGLPGDPAVQWLNSLEIRDHIVETPVPPPLLERWDLGPGETAVLSLALVEKHSPVVIDDLAARKFAMAFNLPLLGTLGLLIRAKNAGLLERVAPEIRALQSAGANLSAELIARALALAGEKE